MKSRIQILEMALQTHSIDVIKILRGTGSMQRQTRSRQTEPSPSCCARQPKKKPQATTQKTSSLVNRLSKPIKSLVSLWMRPKLASLAMLWLPEQNTTRTAVVRNFATKTKQNKKQPKSNHFQSFVIFLSARIEILVVCRSCWRRPSSRQCKYSHRT